MAFLTALGIGASLLGGLASASAGNEAADAQSDAAADNIRLQREMFDRSVALSQPAMQAGNAARDLRLASFGIGPTGGAGGGYTPSSSGAGGSPWGAYVAQNADLRAAYQQPGIASRFGSEEAFGEWHHNTFGQQSRTLPASLGGGGAGQPGAGNALAGIEADQSPTDLQDMAYNRFLNSGYNKAATDVTQSDLGLIRDAYGAGGSLLSGSAQGAMSDRNTRNRYGAYTNYDNALAGISGAGQQSSQLTGQQGMSFANAAAGQNTAAANATASSYGNMANAFGGALQGAGNALAYGKGYGGSPGFGGGWFGG